MTENTTNSRQRFWLALVAMIVSVLFGLLSLSTFATGTGLAMSVANSGGGREAMETLWVYEVLGWLFLVLTPTSLWLAWKLRPKAG